MSKKLDKLLRRSSRDEDGFTLLELIIVVIVVGIIAAIAIPIFSNQQSSAVDASLKSDLKNALIAMQTESAKSSGKFPSYLPLSASASRGNTVVLVDDANNSVVDSKLEGGNQGWGNKTITIDPPVGSSPPPVGNSVVFQGRDHMMNSNMMTVKPGDQIEITVTARQIAGTLPLQAGIWVYSGIPSKCAPYLIYPTITNREPISTFPGDWATYRQVITVPSMYNNTTEVCTNRVIPPSIGVAPFFQIGQGLAGQDPNGTNKWEASNIIYRNLSDLSQGGNSGYVKSSDGTAVRVLQEICIEARNEGNPDNIWKITNVDGVPTQGQC